MQEDMRPTVLARGELRPHNVLDMFLVCQVRVKYRDENEGNRSMEGKLTSPKAGTYQVVSSRFEQVNFQVRDVSQLAFDYQIYSSDDDAPSIYLTVTLYPDKLKRYYA